MSIPKIGGGGGGGTSAAGLTGPGLTGPGGVKLPDPRDPTYPYPRPPDAKFPDPKDPNKYPVPGEKGYPDPKDPDPYKFPQEYTPPDLGTPPGGLPPGGITPPGGTNPGGSGGGGGGGEWGGQNQVVEATPEMLNRESQLWGDTAAEVKQAVQQRIESDDTSSIDFGMMRAGYQPYSDLTARLQKWARGAGDEFTHISEALKSAAGSYRDVDETNAAASNSINV